MSEDMFQHWSKTKTRTPIPDTHIIFQKIFHRYNTPNLRVLLNFLENNNSELLAKQLH